MSNKLVIRGIENRYFTVILLMAQLSTHIRQLSSFFGVSSASTVHGLMLSHINPFWSPPLAPVKCRVHLDSCDNEEGLISLLWGLNQCGVVYLAMVVILQVIWSE